MARFVAYGTRYSHGVQTEIVEHFASGNKILQRTLEAQFDPQGITEHEVEQGSKVLQIHGLPEDRIEGSEVSPRSRLAVFDSKIAQKEQRWTEAEHDLVVETLRKSDRYGMDFIEVEPVKRPAPWNGYDKLESAEKIAELTLDTESDPAEVLKYERENADREEVIAELEALIGDTAEEPITIEA
jgi:hypothetical protein